MLVTTVLAYLPSLAGGWLNWDDPWLVRDNPLLAQARWSDLWTILTDLSRPTRLALGAEYLPLRDLSYLFESRFFGLSPAVLRIDNLLIYLLALLLLRRALRALMSDPRIAELAIWIFALAPVHVESVAWIAGRKDLVALLCVSAAFSVYARRSRSAWLFTALLLALSMLGKSMSIAAVALLPMLDLLAHRRPDPKALVLSSIAVALVLSVQLYVGRLVGMTAAPAGGTMLTALATMGPVWLRYLYCLLWPGALSLVHDVPTRTSFDAWSIMGYGVVVLWLAVAAIHLKKKRQPWLLASWLAFVVPLVPVSQILFSLQNRMADRYLWLSALAPALLLAGLISRFRRAGWVISVGFLVLCGAGTAQRANLFGDSALVFADATAKTRTSTAAPYQLAMAYEAMGDDARARAAYRNLLERSNVGEPVRRATNNLARLEARHGHWREAERVLRRGLKHFADDAKMRDNLQKVLEHLAATRGSAP